MALANIEGYQVGGKNRHSTKECCWRDTQKIKSTLLPHIFQCSIQKFSLVVMLDEPKINSEYVYNYRDGSNKYKGTPFNTAGWTSVEVVGQIIEKIGPILATKY